MAAAPDDLTPRGHLTDAYAPAQIGRKGLIQVVITGGRPTWP